MQVNLMTTTPHPASPPPFPSLAEAENMGH